MKTDIAKGDHKGTPLPSLLSVDSIILINTISAYAKATVNKLFP